MDATDTVNVTPSFWAARAYAILQIKASGATLRTLGSMPETTGGMTGFI
jgi:hypothetical protein